MADKNALLSMVITSYTPQRFDDLCLLLQSIKAQRYPHIETNLVIDQSPELARKAGEYASQISLPIRVLVNEGEAGVNVCRNMGIAASHGEIVAVVDDDVVLDPGWAAETVRSYSLEPSIAAVTGPASPRWEGTAVPWIPKEFYWMWALTGWDGPEWQEIREIRNVGGMNCSYRREALLKAGLYQTRLGPKRALESSRWFYVEAEEMDLSLRIRRCMPGSRIIYNPRVETSHKVHQSRLTWSYIVPRAFRFGYTKRHLEAAFKDDFEGQTILDMERDHLRHILLRMPLSLAREFPRDPLCTLRKSAVAFVGTLFAGLGYLAYFVRPYEHERTLR